MCLKNKFTHVVYRLNHDFFSRELLCSIQCITVLTLSNILSWNASLTNQVVFITASRLPQYCLIGFRWCRWSSDNRLEPRGALYFTVSHSASGLATGHSRVFVVRFLVTEIHTPRRHCSSGNTRDCVSSIQDGENIRLEVTVVQRDLTQRRTKNSEKAHTVSFDFRYRCGFLFLRCYIMYMYIVYTYVLLILSETVRQREKKNICVDDRQKVRRVLNGKRRKRRREIDKTFGRWLAERRVNNGDRVS